MGHAPGRAAGGSQVVAAQAAPTLCATQSASALSLTWACGAGTAVPWTGAGPVPKPNDMDGPGLLSIGTYRFYIPIL
jgi:hypothetical protein